MLSLTESVLLKNKGKPCAHLMATGSGSTPVLYGTDTGENDLILPTGPKIIISDPNIGFIRYEYISTYGSKQNINI